MAEAYRRRQAPGLREAAGDVGRGRAPDHRARRGRRPRGLRAVRLPLLRLGAGGARAHRAGRRRAALDAARLLPAGLARLTAETNWRVDPGARRRLAGLRRHRRALVRPHGVHDRAPDRAAGGADGSAFPRRHAGEAMRPVDTEDGAVVAFETDLGAVGSVVVSQVSPGRKNRLWFSFDGPAASYSFDQELPDALWVGGRSENRVVLRGPDSHSPAAARFSRLPAGHPQGYQDAFDAFVADVHAAVAGDKPDGLPLFRDGLRAAVLTEAVVSAAVRRAGWRCPHEPGRAGRPAAAGDRQDVPGRAGARRRRARGPRRRGALPARPERRGQVDAHQGARRRAPPGRRHAGVAGRARRASPARRRPPGPASPRSTRSSTSSTTSPSRRTSTSGTSRPAAASCGAGRCAATPSRSSTASATATCRWASSSAGCPPRPSRS